MSDDTSSHVRVSRLYDELLLSKLYGGAGDRLSFGQPVETYRVFQKRPLKVFVDISATTRLLNQIFQDCGKVCPILVGRGKQDRS